MNQYLLATYAIEGNVPGAPSTPEEWQQFMERVSNLEAEMDASGAFVFSGGLQLQGSDGATVIRAQEGEIAMSKGSFTGSETVMAGFYVINAENLEAAHTWAGKVAQATHHPIEVRPFHATGRLKS